MFNEELYELNEAKRRVRNKKRVYYDFYFSRRAPLHAIVNSRKMYDDAVAELKALEAKLSK
jgi:hypothetical protein